MATPIFETSIQSLPLLGRGKVRDIYAVDADKLLIVTSDRLSAFDVILPDPIPDKGRVLVALANFWFDRLGHILPNQLTGIDPETVVARKRARTGARARAGGQAPEAAADRGGGARLRDRLGLEGLPGHRRDLRHRAAGAPAAGGEAAGADLHALVQGRHGRATRTSPSRRRRRAARR